MAKSTTLTAGIDTAKDKLDAAIAGVAVTLNLPNDGTGWKKLASVFAKHKVGRIGIEATGGYERGVVRALQTAGFCVVVLQPLRRPCPRPRSGIPHAWRYANAWFARGKKPISALVACARQLLIFANTVVQRGTPWEAKPAQN